MSSSRPVSTSRRRPRAAAKKNPNTWFIGVDQHPCIDADRRLDPTSKDCSGDISKLLPGYVALDGRGPGRLPGRDRRRIGHQVEADRRHRRGPVVRSMRQVHAGLHPRREVDRSDDQGQDGVRVGQRQPRSGSPTRRPARPSRPSSSTSTRAVDVLFQAAGSTGADTLTGKGILDAACTAGTMPGRRHRPVRQLSGRPAVHPDQRREDATPRRSRPRSSRSVGHGHGWPDPFRRHQRWDRVSQSRMSGMAATSDTYRHAQPRGRHVVTCPPAPTCGKTPAPKIGD